MAQKNGKAHAYRSNNPASNKQSPNGKQLIQPKKETKNLFHRLIGWKGFPLFTLALFVVVVIYQTIVTNRPVIRELHDRSPFFTDLAYLEDCLSVVGGFSQYVASFFNSFFLFPWLGTIIYTAFLLLVVALTSKTFNLKGWLFPLALIPSLFLLLSLTQSGYMIYMVKLKAFTYVNVLGILITLTGALLASTPRKPLIQSLVAILYMLVAYPVAGVYGVAGTLLLAVYFIKRSISAKEYDHLIPAGVALLAIWLIPLAYDQWVYETTNQKLMYLQNLPDFWYTKGERILWLPYLLMAGCLLLFALIPKKRPSVTSKLKFLTVLPLVLFLAAIFLVDKMTYKDDDFKTELNMTEASEKGDWSHILKLAKEEKEEPTRLMVMYTNMALFKLGKLGDEMYHYPDGNKTRNEPLGILDVHIAAPFLYFNYGRINFSYRWCMENTVEYGQSITNLTYFVLSSAVNGQKELAEKYNNLLAKCLFHKSLAKKLALFIENPSLLDKDPVYCKVLSLTHYGDNIGSDYSKMEQYLQFNFAYTMGGTPDMIELCLMSNLDYKNSNLFWPAYFALTEKYNRPLPIHIQEAALLFNFLQKTNYIDTRRFSPAVIQRFNQFMSLAKQYAGLSDYEAVNFFKESFGDTYWYYYAFIKNHSTPTVSNKFSPYSS